MAEAEQAIQVGAPDLPLVSVDYHDLDVLHAHGGEFSAARDVDPAEPLMAAEVLFNVALPVIAAHTTTVLGAPP